jgi:two-component system, OmpR family, phosphate regulon sensor histidine kinase PhoR
MAGPVRAHRSLFSILARKGIFARSLLPLSAAILVAAAVFGLAGGAALGSAYAKANEDGLARTAFALAAAFPAETLSDGGPAAAFASRLSGAYRVTLILPDGRVVADSEADPRAMDNHASRPEVAAALALGSAGEPKAGQRETRLPATTRRESSTVGDELYYAAAPVFRDGSLAGVLRLSLHAPTLNRALAPSRWSLALAALAFAAAAIAAALAFSRMTARPIAALAEVARVYGAGAASGSGEGARALGKNDPEELRLLALTLDSMASEIGSRIASAEAQGRELEAILDAMSEAVLALDSGLRITLANPAARALFCPLGAAQGRGLLEFTRASALQEVAASCLASGERNRVELTLFLPSERFFQALAAPLRRGAAPSTEGPLGPAGGVVLVLGDITELRRLERVRRDFVANVSHELRTPVQLVKGFAEALRDGALGDPDQAARFVGIIERNAERMESLISDLLSLAALEREGREWLEAERRPMRPILEAAREAVLPKAEARGMRLILDCEAGLEARVDPGLLEQAIVNLVDNAIKYSKPGKEVRVSASADRPAEVGAGSLVIEVRDQGIGIPARDLPRVFERFYRVDKARSRELGGTGLGLAIVRHIARAHGGEASVESWEGEGSTFRIRIPL